MFQKPVLPGMGSGVSPGQANYTIPIQYEYEVQIHQTVIDTDPYKCMGKD